MHALKPKTADKALGRWSGILQALGIDPRFLSNKHGPCPFCGGKDRYRFDDKGGRGTWICSQCGAGDGFRLLQRCYGWTFSRAAAEIDRIAGAVSAITVAHERTDEEKMQALQNVWNASKAVTKGDPVWLYLHNRLGIDSAPTDIRFHPGLCYIDENGKNLGVLPAMIARLRRLDGKCASIHRTYLTDAGSKAQVPQPKKIMPGMPLNGATVRLSAVQAHLGIAEGIETALAASERFGVPVWAATTSGLLQEWKPPVGVKRVLIAGDNDANYTGQSAAFALARRLTKDGYAVEIQIPETEGKDWADEPR